MRASWSLEGRLIALRLYHGQWKRGAVSTMSLSYSLSMVGAPASVFISAHSACGFSSVSIRKWAGAMLRSLIGALSLSNLLNTGGVYTNFSRIAA